MTLAGVAVSVAFAGAVLIAGVATDGPVSPLVPWGRVIWMTSLCVATAMLTGTVLARRVGRLDVLDAISAP
jgi:ABC-type antimicrobial peptide transport system permease subunit